MRSAGRYILGDRILRDRLSRMVYLNMANNQEFGQMRGGKCPHWRV